MDAPSERCLERTKRRVVLRDRVAVLGRSQMSRVNGKTALLALLLQSDNFKTQALRVQILDSKHAAVFDRLKDIPPHIPVTFAPLSEIPMDPGAPPSDDEADPLLARLDAARHPGA